MLIWLVAVLSALFFFDRLIKNKFCYPEIIWNMCAARRFAKYTQIMKVFIFLLSLVFDNVWYLSSSKIHSIKQRFTTDIQESI